MNDRSFAQFFQRERSRRWRWWLVGAFYVSRGSPLGHFYGVGRVIDVVHDDVEDGLGFQNVLLSITSHRIVLSLVCRS